MYLLVVYSQYTQRRLKRRGYIFAITLIGKISAALFSYTRIPNLIRLESIRNSYRRPKARRDEAGKGAVARPLYRK